jgi:hypothetical protein
MRMWQALVVIPALALAVNAADKEPAKEPAKEPSKAAEPGTLVVVDAAGKEQKLKAWKFTAGTRRLGWLAPAPAPEPKKDGERNRRAPEPAGPEALEFRPDTEIKFVEGVVLLIPLDRLRSLDYDNEMETVTAKVAVPGGMDESLTGSTKYKKINKLVLEAEVDKGDLGIAEVRFLGGLPRGIRGIRFPAPQAPAAAPAGRPAVVTSLDGTKKTTHKVTELMPLYRVANGEFLRPILMFRKTLKIDVAKVRKITVTEGDRDDASWQVQLKDGGDETLVLLPTIEMFGRKGTLEGVVGRVPVGWKLFPTASISEIVFDSTEEAPKEDKPKEDK